MNGKILRLHVDDERFDVRFGGCRSHEPTLDFRAGDGVPVGPGIAPRAANVGELLHSPT